jgi:hypothetical protein
MLRRCPDVSSPHLDRGRDLRCCALGKTDAGYGWLRVQLEQPSVLLLRHSLGGPRGVAVAMFRPSGLGMLICVWGTLASGFRLDYARVCPLYEKVR